MIIGLGSLLCVLNQYGAIIPVSPGFTSQLGTANSYLANILIGYGP